MKRVSVPAVLVLFLGFSLPLMAAPFFQYYNWEISEPILRFPEHHRPAEFVLQTATDREHRMIERSLFWGRGGTRLESVKAEVRDNDILLLFSTRSETAAGLSLYLYIYPSRDIDSAKFTIEIPVSENSGPVVLWSIYNNEPRVVGTFLRRAFYVEARIPLETLPSDLGDIPFEQLSLDLRSSYFDGGRYEEFHHATIFPAQLSF
ncbi:MAG: hypothetical protein LC641_09095 [Spirochaeta sp.]|nr:hypothetical protein [Spirochaeta sp.]